MTPEQLDALGGSRIGEGLIVHAWYDGRAVASSLEVVEWSVTSDATRQVRTQVSATVADAEGRLAPWAVDDPLGVGGARLQLIYSMGQAGTVDLGWYRITASEPVESWQVYRVPDSDEPGMWHERVQWVSGGARIPVTAEDLTREAQLFRLLAPESPPASPPPTVLSEVRRLLDGVMPVVVAPGVTDAAVPTSLVYERERLDAVEDLLTRIGCSHRMTGDGQLEVYPTAPAAPVWVVDGGELGVLVTIARRQSLDGMYNGAVSEGADPNNLPLIGRAFEESGPLRWGGPHGRYPVMHSATGILRSQAAVDTDARTRLATEISRRSVLLDVTASPHPGLQPGDWVQVAAPVVEGRELPLVGVVRSTALRGTSGGGVARMGLTVECAYDDVVAARAGVRR